MKTHSSVDERPSQCLTMSLIAECTTTDSSSSSAAGEGGSTDERADDMLKIEILRLDWQRIASIQNLDVFTNVRELYLQHNRIEVIEELDTLRSLEFLALGSNRIRRVENLRHLNKVLDLSNNMVEDVDTQELPHDLVILNLASNPCCQDPDLEERVTCALPSLMILNGEPVDPPLRLAGVKESEALVGERQQAHENRELDGSVAVTLYVTVHAEEGRSSVVPLSFSSADNVPQKASQFCIENGLHSEAAKRSLTGQMAEAINGNNAVRLYQAGRPPEAPESTDTMLGSNERLQAIVNLQKVRARVLEESTASFEQHKKHLLSTTRKAVERKTAAAQGRSNDLEEGIRKILDDAHSELQLRRARVSAENRKFAADMRRKVDQVLADRRQGSSESSASLESSSEATRGVDTSNTSTTSLPNVA